MVSANEHKNNKGDKEFERIDVIDREIGVLAERIGGLNEERALLMKRLGRTGLRVQTGRNEPIWISEAYDLNRQALNDLGFRDRDLDRELPSLEQIVRGLGSAALDWLKSQSGVPSMLISPRIQGIGLKGTKRAPGLISRFDLKQEDKRRTSLYHTPLIKFSDRSPVHDDGFASRWVVEFLLNDTKDPLAPESAPNGYDENGLVYVGMNVASQRRLVEEEAKRLGRSGVILRPASIRTIILANAQRRVEGKPFLDRKITGTRLIHYPDVQVYHRLCVPLVKGQESIMINRSAVEDAMFFEGVRRVIQLPSEAA